jgi:hypothetical protein
MRALVTYGVATVMVVATAMPAMARSWDVCINPATDLNVSSENASGVPFFFSAVANVYPSGTFHEGTSGSPILNCSTPASPVGTFFAKAALVANLPTEVTEKLTDVFFVDWLFRINGKGYFATTGPVPSGDPGTTYVQIFTGSNGGLAPATGKAKVRTLSNAGDTFHDTVDSFRITTP